MSLHKILIVEDDEIIAQTEKTALEQWNYQVECVEDFKNILDKVKEYKPDLILLDIGLPFYNGFYWCRQIRTFTKNPIVFVSSADDNMNIVMAMEMGGDDFISKPFDLDVLTAKINAIIRRNFSYKEEKSDTIIVKDVVLNKSDGTIQTADDKCELTKNEFKIMQLLMENAGSIVSRDDIMMKLWEGDDFIDDNTLTVNITRIRKKLKTMDIDDYIITKKGIGYIIEK